MSIWIEIHCDARFDRSNAAGDNLCRALNGEQPGVMAGTASDVPIVLRRLIDANVAAGWKWSRGKFTCPACIKTAAIEQESHR